MSDARTWHAANSVSVSVIQARISYSPWSLAICMPVVQMSLCVLAELTYDFTAELAAYVSLFLSVRLCVCRFSLVDSSLYNLTSTPPWGCLDAGCPCSAYVIYWILGCASSLHWKLEKWKVESWKVRKCKCTTSALARVSATSAQKIRSRSRFGSKYELPLEVRRQTRAPAQGMARQLRSRSAFSRMDLRKLRKLHE